jgi:two-component system sensor histidine kinase YesM
MKCYPLRERWYRLSLRSKMILLYIVVVLLPSCLLVYSYYLKSSAVMQEEIRGSMLQTLKQAELNLSNRLNNAVNVANVLTSNPLIYEYLTRHLDPGNRYQQYLDYMELEKYLESLEKTPAIWRIRLYIDSRLLYAREHVRYFSLEELAQTKWYEHALQVRGGILWLDTYDPDPESPEKTLIVSSVRVLRDPGQFDRVIGVLVVDIKEEELSAVLADIDLGKNERIALINPNGRVISHAEKSSIGENVLERAGIERTMLGNEGYVSFRQSDQNYTLLYQTIPMTGWKLVAEVPESAISGKSVALNRISAAVVIVATLVIFILVIVLLFASIAEGMSERIRKLIRVMKQEGLDHLDDTIAQSALVGDISTLERTIGRMIQTVKALAEDSFRAKLQEREASLKALQAQINPHFLYNTLEAINWMAIRRKADDISDMINALSKYFRLSLNKGRDIVTVQEEMTLVKAYLDIQQTRFQGAFETVYEVPDEALGLLIPKLTLQPIVENALLHGLRSRTQHNGVIAIRMQVEPGEGGSRRLVIRVEDNGVGIPADKLDTLLQRAEDKHSYGLYNVNERIRLFGGEGSGLHLESAENRGTVVTIRLTSAASGEASGEA